MAAFKKINLLLPADHLARLDKLAKEEYLTRSDIIRHLVREAVAAGEEHIGLDERKKILRSVRGIWGRRRDIPAEVSSWRRNLSRRLLP